MPSSLFSVFVFSITEIGCLEDVSESESTKALPWNIDYLDNHPYVEITSRRRRVRRSGSQRSPLARKNARAGISSARAAPDAAPLANLSCSGESVRIKIRGTLSQAFPKHIVKYRGSILCLYLEASGSLVS